MQQHTLIPEHYPVTSGYWISVLTEIMSSDRNTAWFFGGWACFTSESFGWIHCQYTVWFTLLLSVQHRNDVVSMNKRFTERLRMYTLLAESDQFHPRIMWRGLPQLQYEVYSESCGNSRTTLLMSYNLMIDNAVSPRDWWTFVNEPNLFLFSYYWG